MSYDLEADLARLAARLREGPAQAWTCAADACSAHRKRWLKARVRCVYCGERCRLPIWAHDPLELTTDHFFPRRGYVVPACRACNEEKADMDPWFFVGQQPDIPAVMARLREHGITADLDL